MIKNPHKIIDKLKIDVAFISEHENGYQGLADKDTDVITIQIK